MRSTSPQWLKCGSVSIVTVWGDVTDISWCFKCFVLNAGCKSCSQCEYFCLFQKPVCVCDQLCFIASLYFKHLQQWLISAKEICVSVDEHYGNVPGKMFWSRKYDYRFNATVLLSVYLLKEYLYLTHHPSAFRVPPFGAAELAASKDKFTVSSSSSSFKTSFQSPTSLFKFYLYYYISCENLLQAWREIVANTCWTVESFL